jgi:hypothetical protein
VVFSWLCLCLAVLLLVAWLHTPLKTPSVNCKVRVACVSLVGNSAAWMFMHFADPALEARWMEAIMRRSPAPPPLNATDPLRAGPGMEQNLHATSHMHTPMPKATQRRNASVAPNVTY